MRHFIIVKFKETVNIEELEQPIRELLYGALKLDGIKGITILRSNSTRPNRHDLMIEMFLTPDGLDNWDNSEIHKTWKAEYGQYIEHKTIFDCD